MRIIRYLMLIAGLIAGLVIAYIIILGISNKIYVLLYTDYTLGLIFPNTKYKSVVIFVTAAAILLMLGITRLIIKLRKH